MMLTFFPMDSRSSVGTYSPRLPAIKECQLTFSNSQIFPGNPIFAVSIMISIAIMIFYYSSLESWALLNKEPYSCKS